VAAVANFTRVVLWLRAIDWRVCAVYSATAVPAVVLGANTLVQINPRLIELMLGGFLLLMIPARRWLRRQTFQLSLGHMAVVGAVIGYLTGLVATTGATKGAYIGTEAASSLAVLLAKGAAFHQLGVIDPAAIAQGLMIGAFVLVGATLSKRLVLQLPEAYFIWLMEGVMVVSGLSILGMAWG
jgi:uncharacterized protein